LQQSTVNSAESIFRKNGGPLKLAALCGRISRIVQTPALIQQNKSSLIQHSARKQGGLIYKAPKRTRDTAAV